MKKLIFVLLLSGCVTNQPKMNTPELAAGTPVADSTYGDHVSYDKFTVEVCGMSADLENKTKAQQKECWKKHDDAFYARLDLFYPYGDRDLVKKKCEAYPIECKDPKIFEGWARDSNNKNITQMNEQQRQIAQQQAAERNAIQAQKLQQLGNQMQRDGDKMMGKPDCESRANIFGGQDLKCR